MQIGARTLRVLYVMWRVWVYFWQKLEVIDSFVCFQLLILKQFQNHSFLILLIPLLLILTSYINNHSTVIKNTQLTSVQYYSLNYKPYSKFISFISSVLIFVCLFVFSVPVFYLGSHIACTCYFSLVPPFCNSFSVFCFY